MTKNQRDTHASLIRQVHTSTRYKAFYRDNRDDYEELLRKHFGAGSSKELSIGQLIELVKYLNLKTNVLRVDKERSKISSGQIWKIEQLWEEKARDKSRASLLKFVKRITKKEYAALNKIEAREAVKVIVALEAMH